MTIISFPSTLYEALQLDGIWKHLHGSASCGNQNKHQVGFAQSCTNSFISTLLSLNTGGLYQHIWQNWFINLNIRITFNVDYYIE